MISSRGRYALRVMIDLAENQKNGLIPMKDVAEHQGISLKYLEKILPALSRSGYIEGTHGKGGGYRLARAPESCRVGDILRLTEGGLTPVSCAECSGEGCDRKDSCRTIAMWKELDRLVNDYLDGITLADLMEKEDA